MPSINDKPNNKQKIMQNFKNTITAYKKQGARIEMGARVKLKERKDFSLWYTPGVGVAALYLSKNKKEAKNMSIKKNSVAIVSDGSAVLGLGNIGPYGALPVMEGKALIFKQSAGIDAWPLVLDTQDADEIVQIVKAIAPGFGGINLEDIAAPKCFEIEKRLINELDIPVMHDDQHATAIVVLAGLLNAVKVVKKDFKKLKIVINGAGAAGTAVTKILIASGIKDIMVLDRQGALYRDRPDLNVNMNKKELAQLTNPRALAGNLTDVIRDVDVFIGLSEKNILTHDHVRSMAHKAIIFALANPDPEILPEIAKKAGAAVVATGRSDFPNQINNALVFPGIFRGALDHGISKITDKIKVRAAHALADLVAKPTAAKIIPDILDARVTKVIARAVH